MNVVKLLNATTPLLSEPDPTMTDAGLPVASTFAEVLGGVAVNQPIGKPGPVQGLTQPTLEMVSAETTTTEGHGEQFPDLALTNPGFQARMAAAEPPRIVGDVVASAIQTCDPSTASPASLNDATPSTGDVPGPTAATIPVGLASASAEALQVETPEGAARASVPAESNSDAGTAAKHDTALPAAPPEPSPRSVTARIEPTHLNTSDPQGSQTVSGAVKTAHSEPAVSGIPAQVDRLQRPDTTPAVNGSPDQTVSGGNSTRAERPVAYASQTTATRDAVATGTSPVTADGVVEQPTAPAGSAPAASGPLEAEAAIPSIPRTAGVVVAAAAGTEVDALDPQPPADVVSDNGVQTGTPRQRKSTASTQHPFANRVAAEREHAAPGATNGNAGTVSPRPEESASAAAVRGAGPEPAMATTDAETAMTAITGVLFAGIEAEAPAEQRGARHATGTRADGEPVQPGKPVTPEIGSHKQGAASHGSSNREGRPQRDARERAEIPAVQTEHRSAGAADVARPELEITTAQPIETEPSGTLDVIAETVAQMEAMPQDLAETRTTQHTHTFTAASDVQQQAAAAVRARYLARTAPTAAWLRALAETPGSNLQSREGWQVVEMRLDDGRGTMTVRTRREEEHVAVTVGFSDPSVRALAQAGMPEIKEALQTQYQSPVDFSLTTGDGNDAHTGKDAGGRAPANGDHHAMTADQDKPVPVSRLRSLVSGVLHEWIG